MNIVEPVDPTVLVRLSVLRADQPFRLTGDDGEEGFGYFIKCEPNNSHILVQYGNIVITDRNDAEETLVFNLSNNGLGIIKSDIMVEPINMQIISERA